ncbi:hypothetical protein ACPUYX_00265 [Desulfosporosinus sp. SYSU MS00001]|uniref:hypothetical protein n=1 Tax=Desulfosporosinus sp. SYSU MS00001 TaxID=3416284 RepID=UPI003CEA4A52
MFRRINKVLLVSILGLTLVGCGATTGKTQQQSNPTNSTSNQQSTSTQEQKQQYLTPVPKGSSGSSTISNLSKQIMGQKDVLGTQFYEQKGILYGDITFKSGVDKNYAHQLISEYLSQLKVTYPDHQITTQSIVEGKKIDSVSFKPNK